MSNYQSVQGSPEWMNIRVDVSQLGNFQGYAEITFIATNSGVVFKSAKINFEHHDIVPYPHINSGLYNSGKDNIVQKGAPEPFMVDKK